MIFTSIIQSTTFNFLATNTSTNSTSGGNAPNPLADRYFTSPDFAAGTNEILEQLKVTHPKQYNNVSGTFEFVLNSVLPESFDQGVYIKLIEHVNTLFKENNFPISLNGNTQAIRSGNLSVQAENITDVDQVYNAWGVKSKLILNLFMVKISGDQGVSGFASFPGDKEIKWDGLFINAYTNLTTPQLGNVIAHEFGHFLGLYHPFDGGCVGDGDWVKDTPPANDKSRLDSHKWECTSTQSTCGIAGQNDLIDNLMDYTRCAKLFTAEQKYRMMNFVYYRATGKLPNPSRVYD